MSVQSLIPLISKTLAINQKSVGAVVDLLESGATIPFIARYRKEVTGSLDELKIADVAKALKNFKSLVIRKESILKSIAEQNKLTPELKEKINHCWDSVSLEDLYLPYKQKRKTRAEIARKNGLEVLAKILMSQRNAFPDQEAQKFVRGAVKNISEAYSGARDIIAEWINESTAAREIVRKTFAKSAVIKSKLVKKNEKEASKYLDYFDYESPLAKCPSHRILAIRRATNENLLRYKIIVDDEAVLARLERVFVKANNESADQVKLAIADCYKRLLNPAIENEFKKSSKEKADTEAIAVFSENVKQILMAAPAGPKTTIGIDPGFRTGCKIAVIDQQGDLLEHCNIYPHPPQNKWDEALAQLSQLAKKHQVKMIAVGNGTAGRESLSLAQSVTKSFKDIEVFPVNESGASIYSASEIARDEFPNLDLTVRGAISIARRLVDPMAELVKIDAQSIGVGQYQHDVNQDKLKESLDQVISLAVNKVGVNLNTASKSLLSHVSGIGPKLAQNIVAYRSTNKSFSSRLELKKVTGLGPKAYEQAAGFLRIPNGKNILDSTAVHPESYALVKKMAEKIKASVDTLIRNQDLVKQIPLSEFVTEQVGLPTLSDISQELIKPALDPRGAATSFSFDDNIKTIGDLHQGLIIPGIISNLTKFGAFVDLGIKENGLIHISQIVDRYISDPAEVLSIDQKVQVQILSVDLDRKRIQLGMKGVNQS